LSIEEEYLDVLQNIEAVVAGCYREYPALIDYDVEKAYQALFQTFRNEPIGKDAVKPKGDLASIVYQRVMSICEWRLGRSPMQQKDGIDIPSPQLITVEILARCIRRLQKSLARRANEGGLQGYLKFISQFV